MEYKIYCLLEGSCKHRRRMIQVVALAVGRLAWGVSEQHLSRYLRIASHHSTLVLSTSTARNRYSSQATKACFSNLSSVGKSHHRWSHAVSWSICHAVSVPCQYERDKELGTCIYCGALARHSSTIPLTSLGISCFERLGVSPVQSSLAINRFSQGSANDGLEQRPSATNNPLTVHTTRRKK